MRWPVGAAEDSGRDAAVDDQRRRVVVVEARARRASRGVGAKIQATECRLLGDEVAHGYVEVWERKRCDGFRRLHDPRCHVSAVGRSR